MAPRFIAKQLSRPTGLFGRMMGALMNRTNARMNGFAIKLVEPEAQDRILEIGFGGGLTLPALLGHAAFVAGVDRSPDVIRNARTKYVQDIKAGRADFREGQVENLPFEAAAFTKVLTVNTVYFWTSLDAGFAEIHRVLSPNGRAVIGFLPKEHMDRMNMPPDIFTPRKTEDVIAALNHRGFRDIRMERPQAGTPWNVIVATRT